MKHILLAIAILYALTSCINGKFLNRSGKEWGVILLNTGKDAAPYAKKHYDEAGQPEVTATK